MSVQTDSEYEFLLHDVIYASYICIPQGICIIHATERMHPRSVQHKPSIKEVVIAVKKQKSLTF